MRDRYINNLRVAVGSSGVPYGYTVTIWTSGGLLIHAHHLPGLIDALLFMAGAVLGYVLAGLVAFGRLGAWPRQEPGTLAVWGNMHLLSIGAAIVLSYPVSHGIHDVFAWPATGFVATAVYLLVLGLEYSAAEVRER
ncbi:hypothetical protein [Rubrobacter calidifluminis]|uniref:hypothetical protein n=1 Tax=Rubrobacter calidifluminis TaxID=1392640 RepID=UPI00235FF3B1|nr:hypothetical protein [Rubrobacter calidifluminis]